MKALRACPVCGLSEAEPLCVQRFVLAPGHPLGDGYTVVVCQSCGFVYADMSATQKDYDIYYARMSKYEDDRTATGAGLTPWDSARLGIAAELIATALPSFDVRIVDVGCANGGLLAALKCRGFHNLIGIDPSPACVRATQAKGIEAFTGSIFALPDGLGEFDCILFSHVFEHILDLQGCLANVTRLNGPNGLLYVEVPDASRYAAFIQAPFQDFNTEHINHFSAQCLRNLVSRQGYEPVTESAREMNLSRQTAMPVISGIFRRKDVVKDQDLSARITEYIRASTDLMQRVDAQLRRQLSEQSEVVLWGTGQLAMKLLDQTILKECRIAACIDGNPIHHGKMFAGAGIFAPSEIGRFSQPIVIATLVHNLEIAENIREMGAPNRVIQLAS